MKIVGIDASTNKTGICIFQDGEYIAHTLIDCHKETDTMKRIPMMANKMCEFLDSFSNIDVIVMEKKCIAFECGYRAKTQ